MTELVDRIRAALADRYAIEREIGSGGMATVYLAEDLKHHRKVAVKVLRPDLAATLGPERFLREIEIAANLQHPHILPLLDSGDADGFLYYVMPYVEGQSLRDRLASEGELPVGEAVRILRDVADALTEAHANDVIHRDIKPENILLRGRHALVTDFGVAKAVSEATGREKLTTAGVALGTPAYMAPEQATAAPHLDHRVDIYAVGAVAYELLTGRPVFMGATPQQVLSAHVTEAPQPVTTHRDTVPPALESVVMRCLEKKPADRFQSVWDLLPQLEALTTPSGGITPIDTRPVAAEAGGRRWHVPGILGAATVLIVAGVFGTQLFRSGPITVTTSNIRAVTSDPSYEWHPALSPDGSQVAFGSVRDGAWSVVIRSTRDVGTELTVAQGVSGVYRVSWSADGESVRFWTLDGVELTWRAVSRLGGPVRTLDLPKFTGGLSPDGSYAVYASGDSVFKYSIADDTSTLLFIWERVAHSPDLSPDGRRSAFVSGNSAWLYGFNVSASSIWIVDADGGDPVRVTGDAFMDISPAWLDGDHLLFVSNRDGPREVYVVEVGSTGPRGEPQKVPGIVDPSSISYSVAGGNLAFIKAIVRQNIWSFPIGSAAVSITQGHPVTRENAVIEEHDVSPDGESIAYCSTLQGAMDIYVRPLEGGAAMRITDLPGDEFAPKWSPDGSEIAFYVGPGSLPDGDGAVMVVEADGGTPSLIASGPGWNQDPRWSPSGLEIAFYSGRTGQGEVWLVSREFVGGAWGEATQLTDFGCRPYDWAPDGSGVLCAWGGELRLVSREGEVLWRYRPSVDGLREIGRSAYSRDGSAVYLWGEHEAGSEGIWAIPARGGEPRLVVAFDDLELGGTSMFSVGPDHLYVTAGEYETDVWVADLEVR